MRAVRTQGLACTRPRRRLPWVAAWIALGALLFGCDEGFEPASKLSSLRVLAVQADIPYPRPGDTVSLQMLWHDGKSPPDVPRTVQIVWVAGCFNPDGDLYYGCFEQLAQTFSDGTPDSTEYLGLGETFELTIPSDIISSRPPAEGIVPYGLSYVFFGICAGRIAPVDPGEGGLPLGCLDSDGNQLGADDFVPGYLPLYSYEEISNANPVVLGLNVAGQRVEEGAEPHFPRQQIELQVVVDPASVELNPLAQDADGRLLMEQQWASYYATAGSLERENKLVNDATQGFNTETQVKYTPPDAPGKVVFYAVVRDNRGGVDWVRRVVWFD